MVLQLLPNDSNTYITIYLVNHSCLVNVAELTVMRVMPTVDGKRRE